MTHRQRSRRWRLPSFLLKGYTSCVTEYNVVSAVELCPIPTTSLKLWYKGNSQETSTNQPKPNPIIQCAKEVFFLVASLALFPSRTPVLIVKMLIKALIPCSTPTLCKHQKRTRATERQSYGINGYQTQQQPRAAYGVSYIKSWTS